MADGEGRLITERLAYDNGREVSVYLPPDNVEAVVFATDGGWHIAELSQALEDAGISSIMIVGVHGLPDDNGRLKEYVPGIDPERFAAYEQFFIGQVGEWVSARFGVPLPGDQTGVWGASLGAEFALAMGVGHPERYGVVLAASPGAGYQPPAAWPGPLPSVHLVAGTGEQFFLDNARRWADALGRAGADVTMVVRDGEHGGRFWYEEFPLMVTQAFAR